MTGQHRSGNFVLQSRAEWRKFQESPESLGDAEHNRGVGLLTLLRNRTPAPRKGFQVVEFGGHVFHLGQLVFLLRDIPNVSVHYRSIGSKHFVEDLNPAIRNAQFFTATPGYLPGFDTIKFYLRLLSKIFNSRYIWVSTGPEHRAFPDLIVLAVIVLLRPHDVILNIRNLDSWTASSTKAACRGNKWRAFVLTRVARFTFERRAQMVEYQKVLSPAENYTCVVPTRFSDSFSAPENRNVGFAKTSAKSGNRSISLRLGLLGTVDQRRRDYGLVLRAIGGLEDRLRAKVEVVILGAVVGEEAVSLVQKIRKITPVVSAERGFLSERDFANLGQSCDLLISPLRKEMGYDKLKGSGAFGDAIFLKKPLLVPSWVDLDGEYDEFCLFYSDSQSITNLLTDYALRRLGQLDPVIWEKYKADHVLAGMISYLGLDP